jgi:hypothetical protein
MSSGPIQAPRPPVTALGRLILLVLVGQALLLALVGNWSTSSRGRRPLHAATVGCRRARRNSRCQEAVLAEVSSVSQGLCGLAAIPRACRRRERPCSSRGCPGHRAAPLLLTLRRNTDWRRRAGRWDTTVGGIEAGWVRPARVVKAKVGWRIDADSRITCPATGLDERDILAPTSPQLLVEPGGVLSATLLPEGRDSAADREACCDWRASWFSAHPAGAQRPPHAVMGYGGVRLAHGRAACTSMRLVCSVRTSWCCSRQSALWRCSMAGGASVPPCSGDRVFRCGNCGYVYTDDPDGIGRVAVPVRQRRDVLLREGLGPQSASKLTSSAIW